jgi:hypothetical protein
MTELARTAGPRLDPQEAGAFLDALGLTLDEIEDTRVTGHLDLGPERPRRAST